MEFRPRNYAAEDEAYSLPRVQADSHPLSAPSPSLRQVDVMDQEKYDFYDPLRASDVNIAVPMEKLQDEESSVAVNKADVQLPAKEWTSFKKFLMQRFSGSKMISISTMSHVIMNSGKVHEKASTAMHLEELDDPEKFAEDGNKVISQKEYVSRLHELKDEITRAWQADDRVTSLRLSIKVARLLMDTSVLQFYPTLFVLATDVMDMLGDMVWKRIKQKAEFSEDGNVICSLPEHFGAKDICSDAKETCNNWFFKIGSISELLPRIYLELAILPCWRFLVDRPVDVLQRLVMMMRGIADPLASAYCRLYMAYCAQKLPQRDVGYLIICINDLKILFTRLLSAKEATHEKIAEKSRLLISLMEPTIEYIIKCIIKDSCQAQAGNVLVVLGSGRNQYELFHRLTFISIILHHLLKELPNELVSSNAVEILELIDGCKDYSSDQCLNYRLLGFRLSEGGAQLDTINLVVDKVIQVASEYNSLDKYLKVVEAYMDIILHNQMDSQLVVIMDGIIKRASNEGIGETQLTSLQSILSKLLGHFNNIEVIFSLTYFIEILDIMHGSSRNTVNMHILKIASRNCCIYDPRIIQFLFEVSQSLHNGIDYCLRDDDNQQSAHLITCFVNAVDYGPELERHLVFLIDCRGAFGCINELKETLVLSSNCLAVKAIKDGQKHLNFVKSCIAFSEVTIPSVPSVVKQFNLYLETAEVALVGGLVSHSDGLLDSAIKCLQTSDPMDGSRISNDADGILCLIQKLCSILVLVPGNPQGVTHVPRSLLTFISSQPWMTSRMRIRVLCAIVSLAATLSQLKLPYHANLEQLLGNDRLFFGDPTYLQELLSFSAFILQNLVDYVMQEPSQVARGTMALEACNCIASSFNPSDEVLPFFSKLMETAKTCLSSNDKYLQSTMKFAEKFLQKDT
ncbi:uncharacterized protein LOC127811403 [Diospyros lotus]|uniref:uncharacterized protein LOC127811403 n=1 Tax=Diospyros lotus TaxID=55363 RepID=UPI0022515BBE|nr:uncharacterized protein LOC127811403 [Diospyros lotus]